MHRFWDDDGYPRRLPSQQKIIHILGTFGAPVSVDLTEVDLAEGSEHWDTNDAYVKVNCDATSFITDIG